MDLRMKKTGWKNGDRDLLCWNRLTKFIKMSKADQLPNWFSYEDYRNMLWSTYSAALFGEILLTKFIKVSKAVLTPNLSPPWRLSHIVEHILSIIHWRKLQQFIEDGLLCNTNAAIRKMLSKGFQCVYSSKSKVFFRTIFCSSKIQYVLNIHS